MITITRRLEFDAGHRILGHEGKCRHLHGHRYVAEITVRADALDNLGRVIDFSVIKEKVGGWIDENWDHNILLHPDDPLFKLNESVAYSPKYDEVFGGRKPFVMPGETNNPTAENLSWVLFQQAKKLLPSYLQVINVRLYETPTSFADYSND